MLSALRVCAHTTSPKSLLNVREPRSGDLSIERRGFLTTGRVAVT